MGYEFLPLLFLFLTNMVAHSIRIGYFCVDHLEEIVWNHKAFDNLVLPGGEKELAWEFVQSKILDDNTSEDFIPGKGE
jgi:hypothetical protein